MFKGLDLSDINLNSGIGDIGEFKWELRDDGSVSEVVYRRKDLRRPLPYSITLAADVVEKWSIQDSRATNLCNMWIWGKCGLALV